MPTGHVFIATSLDGFIARPDGGLDWLESANASGEGHGYEDFAASIDGIFMGRQTLEVALQFDPWPYTKPLIVLSSQLRRKDLPDGIAERVSVSASVEEALAEGAQRGWRRAYVDGGATIRSFLRAGAIPDMVVTRIPVLLGEGIPLFGPLDADIRLRHRSTRSFPSGLVQSRYEVAG
jgi:dihydrofolate reductase